jgi:hypothetical protein
MPCTPGEHVKQRAVRIVPQIDSLPGQLPQRERLARPETRPDRDRHLQPARIAQAVLALERSARQFERPTAREDQRGAQPQQRRNLNVLPMRGRLARVRDRPFRWSRKACDRDQQESHGEQASARNTAVGVAVVVRTTAAAIERVMIARTAAVGPAGFYFQRFSYRHTFVISQRNA